MPLHLLGCGADSEGVSTMARQAIGTVAGNKAQAEARKPGKVRVVKAAKAAKGKAQASKRAKAAQVPVGTGAAATLRARGVEALLQARADLARADLKGHYAIRRALRANGYYISANR